MATCKPTDNTISPPVLPAPPDIGIGGPVFSPPQVPFPDITLPDGIPEDIISLLQNIFAKIPGGTLVPNADESFRNVFSAVASLLNQLGPYLALYNFFQALLEMIMCIIDVICALLNPFAIIGTIIRLFKRCIPNFLSLFPFLALIAMILAFLLLLIALIEFLINYIISLINDIIVNIEELSQAFQVGDEEGILAITRKIASLLCLIEQAFALLIAFQALFSIISQLMALGGRGVCSPSDACCIEEFCPNFIRNSPDGIEGIFGRLVYHRAVNQDVLGYGFPASVQLPALRTERWQFVDDNKISYPFKDIITPINGNIYWPGSSTFAADDNLQSVVPYTIDLNMTIDPSQYNNNISNTETRTFVIKNIVVSIKPYVGVMAFNNATDYGNEAPSPLTGTNFGNYDGTLQLTGGIVFEEDGVTPVLTVNGGLMSLNTFITDEPVVSFGLPSSEDGYEIPDINYTLNINHKALFKYQLITAGCIPEVSTESALVNATTDISSVVSKIGSLPDLDSALDCLNQAMSTFRQNVSPETAAVFQSSVVGCLENLKTESEDVFKRAFTAGASIYTSELSIDPNVQFISEPIIVTVNIKDQGGNDIGVNIPQTISQELADLLQGSVTFGEISDFSYDGSQFFTAEITSNTAGSGEVSVELNSNMISSILNRDSDAPTEIQIKTLPYRFVGAKGTQIGATDSAIRRDESDVANSE